MGSLIIVFIFVAVLTTALGQNYNTNGVTNSTQDYLKIAQAELFFRIKLSEMENDAVDARFLDRLAVIELQQEQVLNETQQVNHTLIPLQALNLVRKYCIQTYDSQFITQKNIKDQYRECMFHVQVSANSLTSYARSFTKNARTHVTYQLPSNVNSRCRWDSLKNNQTQVEECYINSVNLAREVVQGHLDKAQLFRDQSIFEMNTLSLQAVQCSFNVEKVVLQAIALTSKKINDCVVDLRNKTALGSRNALN